MVQIKKYGMDMASYQPDSLTFMQQLKNAGAAFVFSKISEGTGYLNPKFINQIVNADKVGMLTAGYHFARFGGNEDLAVKEGDYAVNNALSALTKGSIIALDYEAAASGSVKANTEAAKTFMRVVKNRGFVPMIYSYKPYFDAHLNLSDIIGEFGNCVWVAGYPAPGSATPNFSYFPSEPGVQIWQFDDNWKGMGVDGNVLIGDWLEQTEVKTGESKSQPVPTNVKYATFDQVFVLDKWVENNGNWYVINNDMSIPPIDYNNWIPAGPVTLTDRYGDKLDNQLGQGNNGVMEYFTLPGRYKVLAQDGQNIKLEIGGEPVWIKDKYVTVK